MIPTADGILAASSKVKIGEQRGQKVTCWPMVGLKDGQRGTAIGSGHARYDGVAQESTVT
jgi:hypothetical protein